jgi:hypothetical protein
MNPTPPVTPETLKLWNVSAMTYDVYEECKKSDQGENPEDLSILEARKILWDAYVALRKLVGDNVK